MNAFNDVIKIVNPADSEQSVLEIMNIPDGGPLQQAGIAACLHRVGRKISG